MHLLMVRESGVFLFLDPAHRILEKQGPFDHRCTKRKNLTHLQSILLFKDSSASSQKQEVYPLASGNIYVQITASQRGGKSRSVVVLVPESARKAFEETGQSKPTEAVAIARKLAEPLARYAFTHRTIFDDYEVSY